MPHGTWGTGTDAGVQQKKIKDPEDSITVAGKDLPVAHGLAWHLWPRAQSPSACAVCAALSPLPTTSLASSYKPLLQPFPALCVFPCLYAFPSCGPFCPESLLLGISVGPLRSGGRFPSALLVQVLMWTSVPDLTVGTRWKYTVAPHEALDKLFQGQKVKLQKKAVVEKRSSPLAQARLPFGIANVVWIPQIHTSPSKNTLEGQSWPELQTLKNFPFPCNPNNLGVNVPSKSGM
ncbi:hypothetical protein P7K49_028777 [Saguinus oedipus]|uniref:Uncharacterized protein n=1 Tax=Saguinus oedipus TaxID=9490 RepID=A0ABQ9U5B2_SAGOE|nr:hypothetical protein P7K49_028777 [Saguinus oedipus]